MKMDGKPDAKLEAEVVGQCEEQKWSDDFRRCIVEATDEKSFDACEKLAPPKPKKSKTDLAGLAVKKLAFEAYPEWSMKHPDKACPDRFDELLEFVDEKTTKDPWGNDYKMFCGANLPAGARGLAVVSAGEDGKEGTADDVKSWE
jgi:hypothetical protein